MPAARAHRLADRHFFRAAARANQKQVHQVDRADEQEKKHAALHQPECRTDGADVIRMERKHRRAEAGLGHHFRFGIVFLDRGIVRVDLRLRFGDRRARFQARDHVRAAAAGMALARHALLRPRPYRQEKPRFRGEEAKIRRQHADDLSRDAVHADVAAENVWIGREALAPVGVGQDDDSVVFRHGRFRFGEGATHREINAQRREKFRRDAHDLDLLGGTGIAQDFGALAIEGKARERRDVAAPLVVIGDRRAVILDSGFRIGVEDRDQPIGLRKRKRTEQNGIDDRENREVRAETDRDRGQRGQREGRSFAKLAKGVAEIVHQNFSVWGNG